MINKGVTDRKHISVQENSEHFVIFGYRADIFANVVHLRSVELFTSDQNFRKVNN